MTPAVGTIDLGTTIHDEAVAITCTGRRWKITLDGRRLGAYDTYEGVLARASQLIPDHRRTNAMPLPPFKVGA